MKTNRLRVIVSLLVFGLLLGALQSEEARVRVPEILSRVSADRLRTHVEKLASIHSRHVENPGIWEAAGYIRTHFESLPGLRVELDEWEEEIQRLDGRRVRMANVVAILPARRPSGRYIVVSGHYDSRASDGADAQSRAPGAVDDASGTAVTMELAEVLSRDQFEANLVFIAFTAEEVGLIGSRHWAAAARERGWNVEAMLTNDIVGNSLGGGGHRGSTSMRVFSEGVAAGESEPAARFRQRAGGEVDGASRQLARYLKEIGETYLPGFDVDLIYRRDRFGRGGDHTAFNEQGYAAVRLSEKYENYRRQHQDVRVEDGAQYGDLPEFYDAEYSARICRVNAAALASLANAPPPPSNVRIKGAVDYDTTLAWDPVAAPDLAGYQILIRDTDAPTWQRRVFVGDVTTYRLEGVIVDNHFFAVQAVDREGYASLAAFPAGFLR